MGDARDAGRETRAATLQFRAVLRHALSWVVDDRNGHNKKKTDRRRRAAARGRRCVVACLAVSAHLAPPNAGITQDRVIPRVLPGRVIPGLYFHYPEFGQL